MNTCECKICGGRNFGLGPGGRVSKNGKLPRCLSCGSLERHRISRDAMERLRNVFDFSSMKVLQFSSDKSVEREWFLSFERSIYGGRNSLDLQKVDRENQSYDLVICNHVLEHVPYDNSALNEMVRLLKPNGICFLSVPSPATRATTIDWGYPDKKQHGHYRVYGADIVDLFARYIQASPIVAVDASDVVTEIRDRVFVICESKEGVDRVFKAFPDATLVQTGS